VPVRDRERERERKVLLTIKKGLKVGKNNDLSGNKHRLWTHGLQHTTASTIPPLSVWPGHLGRLGGWRGRERGGRERGGKGVRRKRDTERREGCLWMATH